MNPSVATARAGANIALVKYWGKRDAALNLPAAGSLSITLDQLETRTTVIPDDQLGEDLLLLDGKPADASRIRPVLERFRQLAGQAVFCRVESQNNFPTGAGLASSASAFAALVAAADAAYATGLDDRALSAQARMGSGSAARSVFGGFVEMAAGSRPDGLDAIARPLLSAEAWPLEVIVAVVDEAGKAVPSTRGMNHTQASSPYYPAWLSQVPRDLAAARTAIAERDFQALGQVAEGSALAMHASALAARPGLIYWQPATLRLIEAVRDLQADGTPCFFTIDAGPQVKVVCLPEAGERVAAALSSIDGVKRLIHCRLGPGVRVLA
ncbi:MAG: diphosphomevalonate decarboxylase [Wenzhouxiangella sp.]